MHVSEGPNNSLECEAPGHLRVLDHVIAIIIIGELVVKRLTEDQPCNCGKEDTDAEDHPMIIESSRPISRPRREQSAAMSRGCLP